MKVASMRDCELTDRPGKGWTPWRTKGAALAEIELVWWQAKVLHWPKLNVSTWFDGSDLVGIEHWGYREPKWCMRKPPTTWQPMPPGYREAAEAAWRTWHEEQAVRRRAGDDMLLSARTSIISVQTDSGFRGARNTRLLPA